MIEKRISDEMKQTSKHLGRRMRERRKSLGLTWEHLAQQLDVSDNQLRKWETGENRFCAARLPELARALKVSISYFFEGLGGVTDE